MYTDVLNVAHNIHNEVNCLNTYYLQKIFICKQFLWKTNSCDMCNALNIMELKQNMVLTNSWILNKM